MKYSVEKHFAIVIACSLNCCAPTKSTVFTGGDTPVAANCYATLEFIESHWNADGTYYFGEEQHALGQFQFEDLVQALNDVRNKWPKSSDRYSRMKIGIPRKVAGVAGFSINDSPQVQEDDLGVRVFFNPSTWTLVQIKLNACGARKYVLSGSVSFIVNPNERIPGF